ncbi:uncharacterized protein LOC112461385 isoform X6 [Temnothorax curvispinosus]|nr:uncharacterized protein LOC112461385 isoform X6 [Temnothorax curvispinosus]
MHKNTDENNQPKSPSVLSTRKRRKTSIEKHEAANILHNIEQNFTQDVSVANATANATVSKNSATTSEISDEEVIEVSPTQRSVPSQLRFKSKLELLKLKRKIPIKRINFGTNNIDSFNLDDRENKPPKKKFNVWSKGKDISEQLNMRCKADRAKLNGWDCWECRELMQYYIITRICLYPKKKNKNGRIGPRDIDANMSDQIHQKVFGIRNFLKHYQALIGQNKRCRVEIISAGCTEK